MLMVTNSWHLEWVETPVPLGQCPSRVSELFEPDSGDQKTKGILLVGMCSSHWVNSLATPQKVKHRANHVTQQFSGSSQKNGKQTQANACM